MRTGEPKVKQRDLDMVQEVIDDIYREQEFSMPKKLRKMLDKQVKKDNRKKK